MDLTRACLIALSAAFMALAVTNVAFAVLVQRRFRQLQASNHNRKGSHKVDVEAQSSEPAISSKKSAQARWYFVSLGIFCFVRSLWLFNYSYIADSTSLKGSTIFTIQTISLIVFTLSFWLFFSVKTFILFPWLLTIKSAAAVPLLTTQGSESQTSSDSGKPKPLHGPHKCLSQQSVTSSTSESSRMSGASVESVTDYIRTMRRTLMFWVIAVDCCLLAALVYVASVGIKEDISSLENSPKDQGFKSVLLYSSITATFCLFAGIAFAIAGYKVRKIVLMAGLSTSARNNAESRRMNVRLLEIVSLVSSLSFILRGILNAMMDDQRFWISWNIHVGINNFFEFLIVEFLPSAVISAVLWIQANRLARTSPQM